MTAIHLRHANLALLSLAVAVLTACGGGSDAEPTDSSPPVGTPNPSPAPSPGPAPSPSPPAPPPPPAPTPAPAPAPAPVPSPPPPPTVGSATLQWTASSDSRIAGYRVYWGTDSRTYQQSRGAGTSTSYVVNNLPAGQTYYFAVTAYDGSGAESAFSAEAVKTIR